MMRPLKALFAVTLLLPAIALAQPCTYDAYRPSSLYLEWQRELSVLGLVGIDPSVPIPALPPADLNVARNGSVVGQFRFVQDVQNGFWQFTVFNPIENLVKLQVTERRATCPPGRSVGLCYTIEANTHLEPASGGNAAYTITWGPLAEPVHFFRYGRPVNFDVFSIDFNTNVMKWLRGVLTTTPAVYTPQFNSSANMLLWALATDFTTAPYIKRFSIMQGGSGKMYITGVVPSTSFHDLVIQKALALGIVSIGDWMTIDTGTRILPGPPYIPGCFPF